VVEALSRTQSAGSNYVAVAAGMNNGLMGVKSESASVVIYALHSSDDATGIDSMSCCLQMSDGRDVRRVTCFWSRGSAVAKGFTLVELLVVIG